MNRKIILYNNLYNQNCCNSCKKEFVIKDKLTCYLNLLRKFFNKYYPNYILGLIGNQETIMTDLVSNGFYTDDTSIFLHLNNNPTMVRTFGTQNKKINRTRKFSSYVSIYNQLPTFIKQMISYVNRFVPYENNNSSRGNFSIKIKNDGSIKRINGKISNNLGIHQLGLIKKKYLGTLNSYGYGSHNGNDFLWTYNNLKIPVYDNMSVSPLKLKLLLLSYYLRGSVMTGRTSNASFLSNLYTNFNSHPISSFLQSIPFTNISETFMFLMMFLFSSNLNDISTDYTVSTGTSYTYTGGIWIPTTSYSLTPKTDVYGNLDVNESAPIYFDTSGSPALDVIVLNDSIASTDTSGNFNLVDGSGNTLTTSAFKNYINSVSYDLSDNIFTYQLISGIEDLSGNSVNNITGYKIYDPSGNIYSTSNYNFFNTSYTEDNITSFSFKQGFDSSGNSLYSFFDLYEVGTNENLNIDYSIVDNEYNTLNTNLNSILGQFIDTETELGIQGNEYSNSFLTILNFAKYVDSYGLDLFITNQLLYDTLKDNGETVDASYNIYIENNLTENNSNIYYFYSVNNSLELYNFFMLQSGVLAYPTVDTTFTNLFLNSSGVSLGIITSLDYVNRLITEAGQTTITDDIVTEISADNSLISSSISLALSIILTIITVGATAALTVVQAAEVGDEIDSAATAASSILKVVKISYNTVKEGTQATSTGIQIFDAVFNIIEGLEADADFVSKIGSVISAVGSLALSGSTGLE